MKRYLPNRPTIPDVVERFASYYQLPENGAWGRLHIVLDDQNVDDHSVLFCKEWALEEGDAEGAALADVLLTLSKSQRSRLSWKVDEWRLCNALTTCNALQARATHCHFGRAGQGSPALLPPLQFSG